MLLVKAFNIYVSRSSKVKDVDCCTPPITSFVLFSDHHKLQLRSTVYEARTPKFPDSKNFFTQCRNSFCWQKTIPDVKQNKVTFRNSQTKLVGMSWHRVKNIKCHSTEADECDFNRQHAIN